MIINVLAWFDPEGFCVVDDLYYQQGDFFQALNSGHSTRLKSFAITSIKKQI